MRKIALVALLFIVASIIFLYFAQSGDKPVLTDSGMAGWRSSEYGYQQEQGPEYWIDVANQMSSKFEGYVPAGIWIVGTKQGLDMCNLQFPGEDNMIEHITFSETDMNEEYLDAFDAAGLNIWLQVEPAKADVGTLIDLVLSRYKNHPSVIGFGVDVEWIDVGNYEDGRPVTSNEAKAWLDKVKTYNPDYKLFLKHWEIEKMPKSYPEDVVFISDSQEFESYSEMLEDFQMWGEHFSDAEVGFQYGYEIDKHLWETFDDPAGQIGNDLIENVPNCRGLYWIDFTITNVFQPIE
ncbi:MAG: hypothetical protein V1818_02260 [Candidatus Aenigmatarchaeota archaeon]